MQVPKQLVANCRKSPEGRRWLAELLPTIEALQQRWSLSLGAPFDGGAGSAWVAPVTRADGTAAVLKLGLPHMEAEHEIEGLRFWDGDPTVRVLAADDDLRAVLL